MHEKTVQDATSSTALKKLVPFIVFREETLIDRKLGIVSSRTTIGRDPGCDVVLDAPGVSPRWGALIRRGEGIFVQHEGGGPIPLEPGEGFVVGPFTIVRADFGTELGRLFKTVEPGTRVQPDGHKPLYRSIVVLGATDMASQVHAAPAAGGALPARLQTYTAEKRASDKANDAIEAISRAVQRAAADATLMPDADPALRTLERLTYAEIIAVAEELAARKIEGVPELHIFFRRFLLAEPVQAFRFRALITGKFAAEARGSGDRVAFPALKFQTVFLLNPDITVKFFELTDAVGKLVQEGVW